MPTGTVAHRPNTATLTLRTNDKELRSAALKQVHTRNAKRRESLGASGRSTATSEPVARKRRRHGTLESGGHASFSSITSTASSSSLSSWSNSRNTHSKRSAHPSYEPPSVKRRKLHQSGRLSQSQPTTTLRPTSEVVSRAENSQKKHYHFCPIQAAKKEILTLMMVATNCKNNTNESTTMSREHFELCLDVWDRIAEQRQQQQQQQQQPKSKVEAVISGMAMDLDLSARRLTRFLKGGQLLRLDHVHHISQRLRTWLETSECTQPQRTTATTPTGEAVNTNSHSR